MGEVESMVEPDGVADGSRREPVAFVCLHLQIIVGAQFFFSTITIIAQVSCYKDAELFLQSVRNPSKRVLKN